MTDVSHARMRLFELLEEAIEDAVRFERLRREDKAGENGGIMTGFPETSDEQMADAMRCVFYPALKVVDASMDERKMIERTARRIFTEPEDKELEKQLEQTIREIRQLQAQVEQCRDTVPSGVASVCDEHLEQAQRELEELQAGLNAIAQDREPVEVDNARPGAGPRTNFAALSKLMENTIQLISGVSAEVSELESKLKSVDKALDVLKSSDKENASGTALPYRNAAKRFRRFSVEDTEQVLTKDMNGVAAETKESTAHQQTTPRSNRKRKASVSQQSGHGREDSAGPSPGRVLRKRLLGKRSNNL